MRKRIIAARGAISQWVEESLRRLCGRISPDRRVALVVVATLLFGAMSIWLTVSSIYLIGKDSGRNYQIEHIERLQIESHSADSLKNLKNEQNYDRE